MKFLTHALVRFTIVAALVASLGVAAALLIVSVGAAALIGLLTAESTLGDAEVDRLLEDLSTVKEAKIWDRHSPRTANAAALLGRYVGVDATPFVPPDDPAPFTSALDGRSNAWLEHPASVASFDPHFWPELAAYDHLDVRAEGAWARWLGEGGTDHGPRGGIPQLLSLSDAAKLHLAAGLAGVLPLEQTIADVRRLGRLVATEPTKIGRLVGVSILTFEGRALERAEELGLPVPASAALSIDARAHFRLVQGVSVVLEGRAGEGDWERLQEAGFDGIGLTCNLARATVDRELVRVSMLSSTLPLESDQSDLTALGRSTLAACKDEEALAAFDAAVPLSAVELTARGFDLPDAYESAVRLPYLRSHFARLLLLGPLVGTKNPYAP